MGGVRTITISNEAYEALKREKRSGESFSKVILRLVKNKNDLLSLAGSWSDISEEEVEKAFNELREAWRKWRVRL